jgi:Domain of unknown function (DUF3850)
MKEHILKTWADYWDVIALGEKNFEVRRDDRGFQKGDVLILRRAAKDQKTFASQSDLRREVTYILTGGQFGIEPGYVVMGLKKA